MAIHRISALFAGDVAVGTEVTVRGWVRTRRDSKAGLSFINLNDGSCFGMLQLVAQNTLDNYVDEVQKLTTGCSIVATGTLVESQGKGQSVELQAPSRLHKSHSLENASAGSCNVSTACHKAVHRSPRAWQAIVEVAAAQTQKVHARILATLIVAREDRPKRRNIRTGGGLRPSDLFLVLGRGIFLGLLGLLQLVNQPFEQPRLREARTLLGESDPELWV